MLQRARDRLLFIIFCYFSIRSILCDLQSFKCFDNGLGRTSGLAKLMSAGQVSIFPDAQGISAFQCASLCLEQNDTCFSFGYHDGQCFLRNISLAHPGLLCGVSVLEGRLRCPLERIGDVFIAFGGTNRTMMECMCGVSISFISPWINVLNVARYDCIESCSNSPCFMLLGVIQVCWVCNDTYESCNPFRDPSLTNPRRVGCMPIN